MSYIPIPLMKLLGNDFFREAKLLEDRRNLKEAIPNYSSAWAFFRLCEYIYSTTVCDMELLSLGVLREDLKSHHEVGMETVEHAKKYMPGMVNRNWILPKFPDGAF